MSNDTLQDQPDTRPDTPPVLRIQLLGGFRVWTGARPVDEASWRLRKARALVKLLALAPDHRLHRERLLDLLWPDLDPEAAANNLRYALHVARRSLALACQPDRASSPMSPGANGGHALTLLQSEGDLLALCPAGGLWTDVAAFEVAAGAARRTQDPAAYGAAIALYAGDLLPEDRYEDWAAGRREELRALYLALLLEHAGLCEARGQHAAAVDALTKLITADPANEGAHQELMRLHARRGQRHQALRQYRQLREALRRDLDAEPDPTSQRLYQDILTGSFPAEPSSPLALPIEQQPQNEAPPAHNLPIQVTSFVGRERELAEVSRLLDTARLVTLTGSGGSGKTRLALQVASNLVSSGFRVPSSELGRGELETRNSQLATPAEPVFPDGVWLVELASLADPALVPPAVASALGVREAPGSPPAETLAIALRTRRLLLVLDNCEHLLDACAALADTLLRACPQLRILATSREALGMAGEATFRVPSLALPAAPVRPHGGAGRDPSCAEAPAGLADYDAIRLFVERAGFVQPGFTLTAQNAAAIVQICQRLDGIPLAIELAAARIGVLAPAQLAARLDDRFRLLTTGNRAATRRHQTLRAVVDWGYDLLAPEEHVLFARLSVFAGGFSLDAADAVCSVPSSPHPKPKPGTRNSEPDVLDILARLVAKSMVVAGTGADGQVRYRLLETLRQYAQERLEAVDGPAGAKATRRRHAAFFVGLAEDAEPWLRGPGQALWLERLETEHDNLRQALRGALAGDDGETPLRLAGALWWFWSTRGHLSEGQRWLEAALSRGDRLPAPLRAKALRGLGSLLAARGHYEPATAAHEQSLALFRAVRDRHGVADALAELGVLARNRGDYTRAATLHEESLVLKRELGDTAGIATSLNHLGGLARGRGEYARAWTLHNESLALWRALGNRWGIAYSLDHLGVLARDRGDYTRAEALHQESLSIRRDLGDRSGIAYSLNNLGAIARSRGDYAQAADLDEASLAIRRDLGDQAGIATSLTNLAALARDQGDDARAWALHQESLALRRELGDKRGIAIALNNLGALARARGDHPEAAALHQESLVLRRDLGDRWGIAYSLDHLAALARDRGDAARAAALYRESLVLFRELGNKAAIAGGLEGLAGLACTEGQPLTAARLFGAAAALRQAVGAALSPADLVDHQRHVALTRDALDSATFDAAWAGGAAVPLEQVLDEVLNP